MSRSVGSGFISSRGGPEEWSAASSILMGLLSQPLRTCVWLEGPNADFAPQIAGDFGGRRPGVSERHGRRDTEAMEGKEVARAPRKAGIGSWGDVRVWRGFRPDLVSKTLPPAL